MKRFKEYGDYDGLGLAALVERGDISAEELLEEALYRASVSNPAINAIIEPMSNYARQAIAQGLPEGPFRGVPFLIKDLLVSIAGQPQHNGSALFKDHIASYTSELGQRFIDTGAVIFGKTNTPEFGVTPITDPALFGSTRNPWHLDHSPSGSSGGSAAAVAARIVPMASGGDGGGSIRTPSSCCGLVGLKPTKGRNPTGPEGELWWGMAVEHVLTRSVRDSAAMLDATAGNTIAGHHQYDAGAPYTVAPNTQSFLASSQEAPQKPLRIGVYSGALLGRQLHPDCLAAVDHSRALLSDLGHHCEDIELGIDREEFIFNFAMLVAADTAALIKRAEIQLGRKASRRDVEPRTWALKRMGESFSAADFANAQYYLQKIGRQIAELMGKPGEQGGYDILLCSSCGTPPPKPGDLSPRGKDRLLIEALNRLPVQTIAKQPSQVVEAAAKIYDFMALTPLANATGQPSMSLPLYWNGKGLPIGSLFTARMGDEASLFSLAGQLEQAQAWSQRQPAICESY